jgi:hypothetical protein
MFGGLGVVEAVMRSVHRCTLRAAAVFGGVAGACTIGLLVWCSAVFVALPAVAWLLIVGSSAVAAAAGGGAGWAIVVRPAGRPSVGTGVAAGLLGLALGYMIHGGIVILAFAARSAVGPHDAVKDLGQPVFMGMVFGYPVSAAVFVPAALVTGAALGWAGRGRTSMEQAEPAGMGTKARRGNSRRP